MQNSEFKIPVKCKNHENWYTVLCITVQNKTAYCQCSSMYDSPKPIRYCQFSSVYDSPKPISILPNECSAVYDSPYCVGLHSYNHTNVGFSPSFFKGEYEILMTWCMGPTTQCMHDIFATMILGKVRVYLITCTVY